MNGNFLKFTGATLLLQAILGVVASKWPHWFEETFISEGSKYGYLARSELIWDLAAIGVIIAFLPQIAYLVRGSLMKVVRLCFHCSLMLTDGRALLAVLAVPAMLFAGLSAGFLLLNLTVYARTWMRELEEHEKIGMNRLIEKANDLESSGGPEASLPIYKKIVALYGVDDTRNVQRKAHANQEQIEVAAQLEDRADDFLNERKPAIATQFYRSSLKILPTRQSAKRRIAEVESSFDLARPKLEKFFALCKAKDLNGIAAGIDDFEFAIRDVKTVRKIVDMKSRDNQDRVLFQLCAEPLRSAAVDRYVQSLKKQVLAE